MEKQQEKQLKCYNCGKIFRDQYNLDKHKQRKTPCLIRDITPENLHSPNRCIYCNKIFSTKENLTKHLKTCKIKNGGMELLADKVMYEQEIRILKEKDAMREKEFKELKEQNQEMKELIIGLQETIKVSQQPIINNTTNNTTNNTLINNPVINVTINSFRKPDLKGIYITQEEILNCETYYKLILEKIFFNKALPQNHAIYLMNRKEKRLLVYDTKWEAYTGDAADDIIRQLEYVMHASNATITKDNHVEGIDNTMESWNALPGAVLRRIQKFNLFEDKLDTNAIYDVFLANRFVDATIKASGCKLIQ